MTAHASPCDFAVEAARLIANTRGNQVVVLDVRGLSPVTDFFVLATGTSSRQMKSVCDEIAEYGREHGNRPLSVTGEDGQNWMLVDFVDVVVHVFSPEARQYYDLDNLWGDARQIDWKIEGQA